MEPPTYQEVVAKIQELIDGKISRDNASSWVMPFIVADAFPDDDAVWSAHVRLAGADAATGPSDSEYLHDEVQFREWLMELEEKHLKST